MVSIEKDGRDKGYLLARMEAIITISHHKKEIKGERARHTHTRPVGAGRKSAGIGKSGR